MTEKREDMFEKKDESKEFETLVDEKASLRKKAVVLLSGGLDSSVNFYWASEVLDVVLALTFDYGQRASQKEVETAKYLCKQLSVEHKVLDLTWFSSFTKTSLVNHESELPVDSDVSIDDLEQSEKSAARVWVPNRNGIFLNIAAGFAEGLGASFVIPGFNLEEATTFADNSQDFLSALDRSFSFSTANALKTKCFTTELNKTQIMDKAVELGLPLEKTWPCYQAEEKWCGECESCQRFRRAALENDLELEGLNFRN